VEPVALRPLSFGEVLDTSFNLFKRNFKSVVIISAVIMVPLSLLGAAAAAGIAPSDLSALGDPEASLEEVLSLLGGLYGALGVGAVLQWFGSTLVQAATTRIYAESYRGVTVELGDAMRHGLRRLPAMLGLVFLSSLGTGLGLLACFLPGIWLYGAWATAPAALIAEDIGPIRALGRSFQLVKQHWWRVFGLLVLSTILVTIISSVVTGPLQFGAMFGGGFANPEAAFDGGFLALSTLLNGLVTAITLPFVAAVVVAIYFDLRVRKEGFDLDRLIEDLGPAPTQAGSLEEPDRHDPFGLG